jgi:hypothetical protein
MFELFEFVIHFCTPLAPCPIKTCITTNTYQQTQVKVKHKNTNVKTLKKQKNDEHKQ